MQREKHADMREQSEREIGRAREKKDAVQLLMEKRDK
jgi:hypothetical protein